MVDLPRYVRPIFKQNGRKFMYFEKHRGTANEWPRIPLPLDPLSLEFAQRVKQCQQLELKRDGDKLSLHFRDVTDRKHDLPSPDDDGFWSAVDKAEEIGKRLAASDGKTFSALIIDYKNSAAYLTDISDGTRKDYDRYLDIIDATWGNDAVADLDTVAAQKAIDTFKDTPSAGNNFRATLSRLCSWGIPRGYTKTNPVEYTEKNGDGGTYEPWLDWQFELFFQYARIDLHLPAYSALFTGQRSVDVMQMRRPPAAASEMPIFAQKTGEWVPIQIHSEYRAIIRACKPSGDVAILREEEMMLHLREDGQAWTLPGFRTAWQRELSFEAGPSASAEEREKAAAMKRLRDTRTVFHGLRKNAVIMLLECGCTEKEVEKIVGMSPAMVAHYAKRVNARRLAKAAMVKLESGWNEMRKSILGTVPKIR